MNSHPCLGTPLSIKMLLHYHCSWELFPEGETKVAFEARKQLLEYRAIKPVIIQGGLEGSYETTELGKAWVSALCNVPPPKQVFLDEIGRVLE